jgi:hypothetical protein
MRPVTDSIGTNTHYNFDSIFVNLTVSLLSKYQVGIEVDKLTNSIVNTISGDSFPTDVIPVIDADLKNITKKRGWIFNWKNEHKIADRQVFKLTIQNNHDIIQGLLSISDNNDHFYLHLIESSPFNLGKKSFMRVFREIYLHLHASCQEKKVIKGLYPLDQNLA